MTTRLQTLNDKLLAALDWLDAPFVGTETSDEELRQRVKLALADRDRAVAAFKASARGARSAPSPGDKADLG